MMGGMQQGGQGGIPPARTAAEQDSGRQVLGQALVGLGRELLSPQPDPVAMAQFKAILQKMWNAMGQQTAQANANLGGTTAQTGVNPPARRPAPMQGLPGA